MTLTPHQADIYRHLEAFVDLPIDPNDSDTYLALLEGPAGTGKTWIMNKLVRYVRKEKRLRVVGIAMTHKARKVLHRSINHKSIITIPTMTIASLLNKTRSHSYIGTNNYRSDGGNKIEQFDMFVIDEVSMISDSDYVEIVSYAMKRQKKILFIGDAHQIPHPTQRLEQHDEYCQKALSMAFELNKQYHLTEIVRQKDGNDLIKYYMEIRKDLNEDSSFKPTEEDGIHITDDKATFEAWIEKKYRRFRKPRVPDLSNPVDISDYRIIVYTNASVNYYNKIVRKVLGYPAYMVVGDFLMGYTNVGFPERIIENGQEYLVKKIEPTATHTIKANATFENLVGHLVSIQELDEPMAKIHQVFMPDIDDENNYEIILELYRLARLVNQKNSTKNDFRKYATLRGQMVFCENVFYFDGTIDKESSFKETHPLLFTSTLDIMTDDRDLYETNKCHDIDARYPKLREFRKEDDKALSETERLADIFQILEKDVDYGYSNTTHKVQGSSYEECFIDDTEFDRIKDRWNVRYNCAERRIREKNQLRYVAYTRPKKRAYVLTKA